VEVIIPGGGCRPNEPSGADLDSMGVLEERGLTSIIIWSVTRLTTSEDKFVRDCSSFPFPFVCLAIGGVTARGVDKDAVVRDSV